MSRQDVFSSELNLCVAAYLYFCLMFVYFYAEIFLVLITVNPLDFTYHASSKNFLNSIHGSSVFHQQ